MPIHGARFQVRRGGGFPPRPTSGPQPAVADVLEGSPCTSFLVGTPCAAPWPCAWPVWQDSVGPPLEKAQQLSPLRLGARPLWQGPHGRSHLGATGEHPSRELDTRRGQASKPRDHHGHVHGPVEEATCGGRDYVMESGDQGLAADRLLQPAALQAEPAAVPPAGMSPGARQAAPARALSRVLTHGVVSKPDGGGGKQLSCGVSYYTAFRAP